MKKCDACGSTGGAWPVSGAPVALFGGSVVLCPLCACASYSTAQLRMLVVALSILESVMPNGAFKPILSLLRLHLNEGDLK